MPTRAKRLFKLVPVLAVALVGCGGTRFYQSGLRAEEKGDAGTAYENYCLAAGRSNSNGIVANGLVRTRDEAAAQSEQAGLAAMDECRYVDAWRHFMRTLDIQPDHATAPPLIRRLEKEYPFVIAAAKREWILRGSVALAVPKDPVLASATPTRQIHARVEAPRESSAEAKPSPQKKKAPAKQPPKPIAIDSSISGKSADHSAMPIRQTHTRVETPRESSAEAKPAPRKKKAPAKQPPKPIAIDSSIGGESADHSAMPIRQTYARVETPAKEPPKPIAIDSSIGGKIADNSATPTRQSNARVEAPAKEPPRPIAIDSSIDGKIADQSATATRQSNAHVEAPHESSAEAKPAPRMKKAPAKQPPKPVEIDSSISGKIADHSATPIRQPNARVEAPGESSGEAKPAPQKKKAPAKQPPKPIPVDSSFGRESADHSAMPIRQTNARVETPAKEPPKPIAIDSSIGGKIADNSATPTRQSNARVEAPAKQPPKPIAIDSSIGGKIADHSATPIRQSNTRVEAPSKQPPKPVAIHLPIGGKIADHSAMPIRQPNARVEAPAKEPPKPIAIDSSIDGKIADHSATPTRQTYARVEAPAKEPPKPVAVDSSIGGKIADPSATPTHQTNAHVEAPGESSAEAKPAPRMKKAPAKQPPKPVEIDSSISGKIADHSATPIRQPNARVEAPGESSAEAKPAPRKEKAPAKQPPKPIAIHLPIGGKIADHSAMPISQPNARVEAPAKQPPKPVAIDSSISGKIADNSATPIRQIHARVEAPRESSAEAKPSPQKKKAPARQPPKPIAIDSSIDGKIADHSATPTRQTYARVEAPGESSAEARPAPRKKKAPAKQPPKPIAIDSSIDGKIADHSATPIRQTYARVETPGESSAEARPAPRKKKAPATQPPKPVAIDSSIDGKIADHSATPTRQTYARVEAPGESSAEARPAPRKRKAPAKQPPKPVAIVMPIDGEIADGADSMAQPSDSHPMPPVYDGGFIAIHTLSLKDRRFPRTLIVVDGIRVVLKDTNSDGQVDLDLFKGKKRIQKVRALEPGGSQSFAGKSDELYRLTLLSVNHKSRTAKFGLKRA